MNIIKKIKDIISKEKIAQENIITNKQNNEEIIPPGKKIAENIDTENFPHDELYSLYQQLFVPKDKENESAGLQKLYRSIRPLNIEEIFTKKNSYELRPDIGAQIITPKQTIGIAGSGYILHSALLEIIGRQIYNTDSIDYKHIFSGGDIGLYSRNQNAVIFRLIKNRIGLSDFVIAYMNKEVSEYQYNQIIDFYKKIAEINKKTDDKIKSETGDIIDEKYIEKIKRRIKIADVKSPNYEVLFEDKINNLKHENAIVDDRYTNNLEEKIYSSINGDAEEQLNKFLNELLERRRNEPNEEGLQASLIIMPNSFAAKVTENDGMGTHNISNINLVKFLNGDSTYFSEKASRFYRLYSSESAQLIKQAIIARIIASEKSLKIIATSESNEATPFQISTLSSLIGLCQDLETRGSYDKIEIGIATPEIQIELGKIDSKTLSKLNNYIKKHSKKEIYNQDQLSVDDVNFDNNTINNPKQR